MSPGVVFSILPDEFHLWVNVYLAPGQGQVPPRPHPHRASPHCAAAGAGGVHEELREEVPQRSGEVPVFE